MKKTVNFDTIVELSDHYSGEKLMLCSLVYRSVQDLSNHDWKVRCDARCWFNAKDSKSVGCFSFMRVCEILELPHDDIIKQLDSLGLFPKDAEERPDRVIKQVRGRRIYRGNSYGGDATC